MMNTSKIKLRTDLIIDDPKLNGDTTFYGNISVTTVKANGNYITIQLNDFNNYDDMDKCKLIICDQIKKLLKINHIGDDDECLIIGLGNRNSTADSLGPLVIEKIFVTRHLFKIGNIRNGIRCVSSFCPDVMGNTGIESSDIIRSLIQKIKPKFVIAIDSLASSSIERINKIVQITDTGIHPGSGVLNNREEIAKSTIGIPVIAIGIPTVVSSAVIVRDTFNYMFKHLSYIKDNMSISKLSVRKFGNYKEKIKNMKLTEKEKNDLSGILGNLSEDERYDLFREVLDSINENLIVTSTEIDFIIDKLSDLISSSLNDSLHRQISYF